MKIYSKKWLKMNLKIYDNNFQKYLIGFLLFFYVIFHILFEVIIWLPFLIYDAWIDYKEKNTDLIDFSKYDEKGNLICK